MVVTSVKTLADYAGKNKYLSAETRSIMFLIFD